MATQRTYVIGDLHLGSPYCRAGALRAFLDGLGPTDNLVLNGDGLDRRAGALTGEAGACWDRLAALAAAARLTWVVGNHDEQQALPAGSERLLEARPSADVLVLHGHTLPLVPGPLRPLKAMLQPLYCARAGRSPHMHPTAFAKRYRWLYRRVVGRFRRLAAARARERGVHTVICGHVHCREDVQVDGVRYLNPGAWVDDDTGYVALEDGSIRLCAADA